jgi:hypothetical protein
LFLVGAGSTEYDNVNEEISISTTASDDKFKIIHEMGHAMADFTTAGAFVGSNYGISDGTCPAEPGGEVHSMRSEEYQSSAGNEGFAHFYSAVSWNDGDAQNSNCWFEYYKTVNGDDDPEVNCDNDTSNADFDLAYLETNCGGTSGRGVELDWMRAFWNVHTSGASNRPTFTAIVNWMDDADPPGDTDVYAELDAEANTVGGQLNTNWDSTKVTNGIDH